MLRFILVRNHHDAVSQGHWCEHETIDADVPALEEALRRGGFGESGHDLTQLFGVELLTRSEGWQPIETAPRDGSAFLWCSADRTKRHVIAWPSYKECFDEGWWQSLPPFPDTPK